MQNSLLNLRDILEPGALFRPPDDSRRGQGLYPIVGATGARCQPG